MLKSLKRAEYEQGARIATLYEDPRQRIAQGNSQAQQPSMNLETIRALNQAHIAGDRSAQRAALERLGNPDADEFIFVALEGLRDPDRNVRFQMLRLLGIRISPEGVPGILRALSRTVP